MITLAIVEMRVSNFHFQIIELLLTLNSGCNFGCFFNVYFEMKKGSFPDHQYCQVWNDILLACASRIKPNLVRHNTFLFFWIDFFCSKNIILGSNKHSWSSRAQFLIQESVPWNTEPLLVKLLTFQRHIYL